MSLHTHATRPPTQRSLRRSCACVAESLEFRRMLSVSHERTAPADVDLDCVGCLPMAHAGSFVSLADSLKGRPAKRGGTAEGGPPFSPIRVQNSRPGAPVTVYLDFDGEDQFYWDAGGHYLVNGPGGPNDPVHSFSLDDSDSFTTAELDGIDAIWAQVAEKFSPFDINVTTVRPASFNDAQAIHMIIAGSTFDWYQTAPLGPGVQQAGGVAPVSGFTLSEASNEGFVFSSDAIPAGSTTLDQSTRHYLAESVAHEAGHLFGLRHQSTLSGNTVTNIYSDGDSITAPIMGASSTNRQKRGIWITGQTSVVPTGQNTAVPNGPQDDLAVVTRAGTNINYRVDDFGSFSGSGSLVVNSQTGLATGYGVIERMGDQDAFTFVATGPVLSFTVNQFTLGGTIRPGDLASTPGMLAPTLELIPISGNAPAVTMTTTNFSATISTINAVPGAGYVLRVSPQGNAYGNIGQYYINGTVGTFASINAGGTLVVNGYNTNNNLAIGYNSPTDEIFLQDAVFGGTAIQRFPRGQVTGIFAAGQGGSDVFTLLGTVGTLNIPVTISAGEGNDTLILQGTSGNDYQALTANSGFTSNNVHGAYFDIESAILSAFDGADTFEVYETAAGLSTTLYGGNQDDTFNVGASAFASNLVQGAVIAFGDAGNDTFVLGSNNADSIDVNMTFDGGTSAGGAGNRIVINDTAPTYGVNYDISSTGINRDGFNVPRLTAYSNLQGIVINCGSGGDNINLRNSVIAIVTSNGNDGNDNFALGGGNMTGTVPQTFNGGNGTDHVTYDDHLSTTGRTWNVRAGEVIFSGAIPLATIGLESVGILAGDGNDDITFAGTLNQALDIDAGGGGDTFTLGFQSAVTFFNPVTLVGGSQGTIFNVNDAAVYFFTTLLMDGGNGFNYLNVNVPNVAAFQLGEGYFIPGNGGTFSYTNINTKVFNGNALDNTYTIYSANSPFGGFTVNGNTGNDTFRLVPQPAGYSYEHLTLDGNQGTDTFIYDATALSTNETYTIGANTLQRQTGGFNTEIVTSASVNTVSLQCGSGNDTVAVTATASGIPLFINGDNGDDTFRIGNPAIPFSQGITTQVSISGAAGADRVIADDSTYGSVGNYVIDGGGIHNAFLGTFVPITYDNLIENVDFYARGGGTTTMNLPLTSANFRVFNGVGNGVGQLIADDRSGLNATNAVDLYPDRIVRHLGSGQFATTREIQYSGYESLTMYTANSTHTVDVYGTSPDIAVGQQTTIVMGNGDDTVTLRPNGAGKRLRGGSGSGDALSVDIATPLGVFGGAGVDRFVVDNSTSDAATHYVLNNAGGASTANIFGIGANGIGAFNDVENVSVKGGSGADTFAVDSFKTGAALGLYGGAGDDTVNFGGGYLPVNITSIASFVFDGQADTDRLNVDNTVDNGVWTYFRSVGLTQFSRSGTGLYALTDTNVETVGLNAGPSADTFLVRTVAADTRVDIHGNGGVDLLSPGVISGGSGGNTSLLSIFGRIDFDAGTTAAGDGGTIYARANIHPADTTVHLTRDSLGAAPGDNLFGAGGSINFANITGLTLITGQGSDKIYAHALPTATVSISAGQSGPTGDALYLALADATGYVVNPASASSGFVTSSNLRTLSYFELESAPVVDAVAPSALSGDFEFDAAQQQITYAFSENVANTLTTAALILTNLTTGVEVSQGAMLLAYDAGTNTATITFPGFARGVLPDGNYHAMLAANYTDTFGNLASGALPFDFFVLGGDANRDRVIDFADLVKLAQNYNKTSQVFSDSDFDYDSTVGFSDLVILAQNYGKTLPAPGAPRPLTVTKEPSKSIAQSVLATARRASSTINKRDKDAVDASLRTLADIELNSRRA